jgi:hypothetical protein
MKFTISCLSLGRFPLSSQIIGLFDVEDVKRNSLEKSYEDGIKSLEATGGI